MVLKSFSDRMAYGSGSVTADGSAITLIAPLDLSMTDRISFQFINSGAANHEVKVYATLDNVSGTLANPRYTQIGDTVTVSGATSSLKSISTTGLYFVGVTASGTSSQVMDYNYVVQNL